MKDTAAIVKVNKAGSGGIFLRTPGKPIVTKTGAFTSIMAYLSSARGVCGLSKKY